jgi:hypothetical protein
MEQRSDTVGSQQFLEVSDGAGSCACGYVIQGGDDDELWANAQGHMGVLHPELVDSVTREDLLAQAELL